MSVLSIYNRGVFAALAGAVLALAITSAEPAKAQPPGQLVSGYDRTGLKSQPLNVDSLGRLAVTGAAAGGSVFGNNAIGTAPTQPPVFTGCYFQTSPTAITNGQIGGFECDSTQHLIVVGQGVAGTPAGGVVSVQGVASGTNLPVSQATAANLQVTSNQATAANLNAQVVGAVANGGTNAGNPVKIGAVFNSAGPTYTTGQIGDLQMTLHGEIGTVVCDSNSTVTTATCAFVWGAGADGRSNTASGLQVYSYPSLYNGTVWNREVSIAGAASDGIGLAVTNTPTSNVNAAIAVTTSSAVESGHVFKASAGNLFRVSVTTGTTSGYLMVFNSTTVPADGAVTPVLCRVVPANSSVEIDHTTIPDRFTTGISAAFSTTGCFTKTASATAELEGTVF